MGSEALERQKALALARARQRADEDGRLEEDEEPEGSERSFGSSLARQAGLTTRALGPTAVGAMAGAAMGAPFGGVGAVPGAMTGALAMQIVQMVDQLGGTNYIEQAMNKLGLPKAESDEEKISQHAVQGMAGMGALAGAAKGALPAMGQRTQELVRPLTENLGTATVAAGAGGAAGEIAAQQGVGPAGQFVAATGASAVAPLSVATGRAAGRFIGGIGTDVVDTARAAFGNQKAVDKITSDVIAALTKGNEAEIKQALQSYTTFVHGTKPTVGEALAQQNLKTPDRQIGGAVLKMQDELTGAKGVEDVLPSHMKANEAALVAKRDNIDRVTTPMREDAINASRRSGGPQGIGPALDVLLLADRPGYRASTLAQKVLNSTAKKLERVMTEKGAIDPEDLYMIRKEIGTDIQRFSKETANFDQTLAAKLLSEVQASIDTAMEKGGAVGWKAYLDTYAEGMERIRRHTGRLEAFKQIAGRTQATSAESLVKDELPRLPTLLHRPTMAVNFALKLIGRDATAPVTRNLAKKMQDPAEFVQLMQRPLGSPARKAADQLMLQAATLINLMRQHQLAEENLSEEDVVEE